MRSIKLLLLVIAFSLGSFASDCDYKFTLTTANPTVTINNKGLACYTWQVTDFVNGFTAVSVQFENAVDIGGTPGNFSAFQGTVVSGSNPNTATTQNTSLYQGAYPWVRINLVSSSGTGNVTGRILGAQATSATLNAPFIQPQISANAVFGRFIVPNFSSFTWVDQVNATGGQLTDGMFMFIPFLSGTDTLSKLCTPLPSPPWTVISAFVAPTFFIGTGTPAQQLLLEQVGGGFVSELYTYCKQCSPTAGFWKMQQCTTSLYGSCTNTIDSTTIENLFPVIWERVVDNGTTREWMSSPDGVNWHRIQKGVVVTGANYANITPTQACMSIYNNNGNYENYVKLISWQVCAGSSGVC